MPIKLNSTGGGSITIDVPNMSTANTLTLPGITGNVITSADSNTVTQTMINRSGFYGGFGPAFAVYRNGAQNLTNAAFTKINFEIEEFDTANCYDNTTNYRFTPNVAGYYLISLAVSCSFTAASASTLIGLIYKNGTNAAGQYITSSGIVNTYSSNISKLIYLNGTTDYIEGYGYQNNGADRALTTGIYTYMTGFLARPA